MEGILGQVNVRQGCLVPLILAFGRTRHPIHNDEEQDSATLGRGPHCHPIHNDKEQDSATLGAV